MSKFSTLTTLRTLLLLAFGLSLALGFSLSASDNASAANGLTVEIIAAPNLVVDSNVLTPASYAPKVATVIGKFCNTGATTLNNVVARIGDYDANTPGIYPARVNPTPLTGTYRFIHLGGTSDATRIMNTIPAGECRYQYWSFTYPWTNADAVSGATIPGTIATWGNSVKADDDLWLEFDMWATHAGTGGSTPSVDNHIMYHRNEISAMANKIEPNGNPPGAWFNTETSIVYPGDTITTNGILYRIGNVGDGFDNDGDGVPDRNTWLQPFGSPAYDPSCFRIIDSRGTLTVTRSAGNPDLIIDFENTLYFTNLPPDNTDVRGVVYYKFLALGGACVVPISPYQEAASGRDNEKFNGDYGGGAGPVSSFEPAVTTDKTGNTTIIEGGTITYTIPIANESTTQDAGLILASTGESFYPVINDTLPDGLEYVCKSADITFSSGYPITNTDFTYYTSIDSGNTWVQGEPASCPGTNPVSTDPNSLFKIRFEMLDPLPKKVDASAFTAYATFAARVPTSFVTNEGTAIIENCAEVSFGNTTGFATECTTTIVGGDRTISGFVWRDENLDGLKTGETTNGIFNQSGGAVEVKLYYDLNNNNEVDEDDILVATTLTTGANDSNYSFTGLAAGNYLVVIDEFENASENRLPDGYRHTTDTVRDVTVAGLNITDIDFGFGPSLQVTKTVVGGSGYENTNMTYKITVRNLRPGGGTSVNNACVYEIWAGSTLATKKNFANRDNVIGEEDGLYATGDPTIGGNQELLVNAFDSTGFVGTITSVEAVMGVYFSSSLSNDSLILKVYNALPDNSNGNFLATSGTTFNTTYLNANVIGASNYKLLGFTIPAASSPGGAPWNWSELSTLYSQIEFVKTGGADASTLFVDVMGFRVTTSEDCVTGGADDVLDIVPLTDVYDSSRLTFVSADPPQTSHTAPTITWTNVGPINAGQSRDVFVTLSVNQICPPNQACANLTGVVNTASVANAEFGDGTDANDDSDQITHNLIPTGSINGRIWSDDGDGWIGVDGYENLEPFIGGVSLTLLQCEGITLPVTGGDLNKTCSGLGGSWTAVATTVSANDGTYSFTGLPAGYYRVALSTSTLPGFTAQTGDPDDSNNFGRGNRGLCGADCDNQFGAELDVVKDLALITFSTQGVTARSDFDGVNFGYSGVPRTIFGYIWQDHDGDKIADSGDNGISGVSVYLCTNNLTDCNPDNTGYVGTVDTDSTGKYTFRDGVGEITISDGTTYYIGVDTTTDLPSATYTNTFDPDSDPGNSQYQTGIPVVAGELVYGSPVFDSTSSYNFGYNHTGTVEISGSVYTDWDGDGTRDLASGTGLEQGITPVKVYLYEDSNGDGSIDPATDALVYTTTTGPDGSYTFTGLPSGLKNYVVVVEENDINNSYNQTGDPDETGTCTICDGRARVTTNGSNVENVNFGYQPTGYSTIGDFVFIDTNRNGIYDVGEEGIGNITVRLYYDTTNNGVIDSGDALVATKVTSNGSDGNPVGYYLFSQIPFDLPAGNFLVQVDTSDPDLPVDDTGSPYVLTSANPHDVTLATNDDYVDADFGFAPLGAIGDRIWQDNDSDGDQDLSEPGIAGVTVSLYPGVTILNGKIDLNGDRTVDDGGDDGTLTYSYFNAATNTTTTYTYTIVDGVITSNNAGNVLYFLTGTPGSSAVGSYPIINGGYVNVNGDNSITSTDDQVSVLRMSDSTLATDVTDSEGNYLFSGLYGGNYIVRTAFPSGYTLTGDPNAYVDPTQDPVCVGQLYPPYNPVADAADCYAEFDGQTGITLALGSTNVSADFGFKPPAYIGDTVWIDLNGDGDKDAGEPGIQYVDVFLCLQTTDPCNSSTALQSTTTDDNGNYSFGLTGNPANTYKIVVNTADPDFPAGLTHTYDRDGSAGDSTTTSIIIDVNGQVTSVGGVSCTDCNTELDFGYRALSTNTYALIGDRIWEDTNGNGLQDAGEPGIPDATVNLYAAFTVVNGYLDLNGDGVGDANDDGTLTYYNAATNTTYTYTVVDGQVTANTSPDNRLYFLTGTPGNSTVGSYPLVGGLVDVNGSTTIATDDDVTTPLRLSDTTLATEVTNSSGLYSFDGLTGGNYVISSTLPGGYTRTGDPDSTIDGQYAVIVPAGSSVMNADFGYQPNGLGDTVWIDYDGNGVAGPTEPGIPDISVSLFSSVSTGSFRILPGGLLDLDSDGDADNGTLNGYTVIGGKVDFNGDGSITAADAGRFYYGSGSYYTLIAGALDVDNDTDIDTNDAALSVTNYYVSSTTTDADGRYNLPMPADGTYAIVVNTTDTDWPASPTLTHTYDKDASAGDNTTNSILVSGGAVTSVGGTGCSNCRLELDFGYRDLTKAIIGDRIWEDQDNGGDQDASEPGIPGVTVNLYLDTNTNGIYDAGIDTLAATDTTDADGYYLFSGLDGGSYVVVVTPPAGFALTSDPVGALDNQAGVVAPAGSGTLAVDFGYYAAPSIGDRLWIDLDNDGDQDAGEPGIQNVTVYLCLQTAVICDAATALRTDVTDSSGNYSFANVPDGTYKVVVNTSDPDFPENLVHTYDPDGNPGDATTSSIVVSGGNITQVDGSNSVDGTTCNGSDCNNLIDLGFRHPLSISGRIFFDAENDGGDFVNNMDRSFEGVPVYLTTPDGVILTTYTDANGFYTFSGLTTGSNYQVAVDTNSLLLSGLSLTQDPDTNHCPSPSGCSSLYTFNLGTSSLYNLDYSFFANMDLGDLPDTYRTVAATYRTILTTEGPYHTYGGLRLGNNWDGEADGYPSDLADGDDLAIGNQGAEGVSDEDGVAFTYGNWKPGNPASIGVTYTCDTTNYTPAQCTTMLNNAYLVMWFDWDVDGRFQADEVMKVGYLKQSTSGRDTATIAFTVPDDATFLDQPSSLNVRVRLYDGAPTFISPTGAADNGEVEDYQLNFEPTAITLGSFSARQASSSVLPFALAALALAGASLAGWAFTRRRKAI